MTEFAGNTRAIPGWAWWGSGAFLLGYGVALAMLSRHFDYGSEMYGRPISALVGLLMAAALVYFGAVMLAQRSTPTRSLAYWVFAVGALLRLVVATSQPILEDDFYRYLWDGAVVAHGHNPYTVVPSDVQARDEGVPEALLALGGACGEVLHRVNHPQYGTVYPPLAQGAFALAHKMGPWRLSGLRGLYFVLDCAAFGLLVLLLRALGRSPLLAVIYWWNPLAIKEIYNSVHMDILLVPLVLGAVLLALRGWVRWSMIPLALAVAIKLWPVLLVPPLLAMAAARRREVLTALALFGVVSGLLLSPLLAAFALGEESGFVAYGTRWEMNDALFMVFPWGIERLGSLLSLEVSAGTAHQGGKLIAMALVAAVVLWATWKIHGMARSRGDREECTEAEKCRCCQWIRYIVAALFLLSPTQFPWYYLWFLPFLALAPNRALIALTFVLPLYYLRFFFDARGQADLFHNGIVWLEYGPIWLLLLFDACRRGGKRATLER